MLLTFIYFLSISFQGEGAHAELTVPFGRRNPCSATALHEKNIIVSMRNAASLCREVYDDAKSFKLAGYCARVCEICSVRGERESYRNLNRTRPPLCYVMYCVPLSSKCIKPSIFEKGRLVVVGEDLLR